MNRLRAFLVILVFPVFLIVVGMQSRQLASRRQPVEATRCVSEWISGTTAQRAAIWRRMLDDRQLASAASEVVRLRLGQGAIDPEKIEMLRALPPEVGSSSGNAALSLCSILKTVPDLPTELRGHLPETIIDGLDDVALDPTVNEETRLRAFAWLVFCDPSARRSWLTRANLLCDLVATRLVSEDDTKWFRLLVEDPRLQEILEQWGRRVARVGVDHAIQISTPSPNLGEYLGHVSDRYAFALTLPWNQFETVCGQMGAAGFRPEAICDNSDGRTCNVIWHRDGWAFSIKNFKLNDETQIESVAEEMEAIRNSGQIVWDVAYRTESEQLVVISVTQPQAQQWDFDFDLEDHIINRVTGLQGAVVQPEGLRFFEVGETEVMFLRWCEVRGNGWRVSYSEHLNHLQSSVEAERRQFDQIGGRLTPLPSLRYGASRRRAAELVLEKSSDSEAALRLLSRCQFYADEFEACLLTLERIENDSMDGVYAAIAAASLGKRELADGFLKELPTDDPSHIDDYAHAIVWAIQGRFDDAVQRLDDCLQGDSSESSYNVACAFSWMLKTPEITEEQRDQLVQRAWAIVHENFESGGESFSDMLTDHDMLPLLSVPELRSRLGIVGDRYWRFQAVSRTDGPCIAGLVRRESPTLLFESSKEELDAGHIPAGFWIQSSVPDNAPKNSIAIWNRIDQRSHDHPDWVRKLASVAVLLARSGNSGLLESQWQSHPSASFKALLLREIDTVENARVVTSGWGNQEAKNGLCRSVAEWQLLNQLANDPPGVSKLVDSFDPEWMKDAAFGDRVEYLSGIASGSSDSPRSGEASWVEVDLSGELVGYEKYAIRVGATEVTNGKFSEFLAERPQWNQTEGVPSGPSHLPASNVTWHQAAAFCNWMSEQSELSVLELCYQPIDPADETTGYRLVDDFADRIGFRLPHYRERDLLDSDLNDYQELGVDVVNRYLWGAENSEDRLRPVATRLPNRWGFYDLFGNVKEWVDSENDSGLDMLLGGSAITSQAAYTTSISNLSLPKHSRTAWGGFRLTQSVEIVESSDESDRDISE